MQISASFPLAYKMDASAWWHLHMLRSVLPVYAFAYLITMVTRAPRQKCPYLTALLGATESEASNN